MAFNLRLESIMFVPWIISYSGDSYITITIDHTKVLNDLTDFPIYVKPTDLWAVTLTDAQSIRVFKSDGSTELPREIVSKDEMHIKTDLSSSADTVLRVVMDWVSSDYGVTTTYGRNNVWSSDFQGVWHMNEIGATATDSSGSNISTYKNVGDISVVPGKIGNALYFGGTGYITDLPISQLDAVLTAYFKADDVSLEGLIINIGGSGSGTSLYVYDGQIHAYCANKNYHVYGGTLVDDTWYRATIVSLRGNAAPPGQGLFALYLDGVLVDKFEGALSSSSGTNASGIAGEPTSAKTHLGDNCANFIGTIDEVHFKKETNDGWEKTTHNNQNSPSTFYTISL